MREAKKFYKMTCINLIDGDKHGLRQFFDLNHVKIPLAESGHDNHPRRHVWAPHLTNRREDHVQT